MTGSYTRSASFTITDARYVGGKIGADLRILHNYFGKPSLDSIEKYVEEVALLLRDGYLNTVDYGFRDSATNSWKLRLRYTATLGGYLTDARAGGLPASADITGYGFYSFLTYSSSFLNLTGTEQQMVKNNLPFPRTTGDAPSALAGSNTTGHGYARNGAGVARDVYVAL